MGARFCKLSDAETPSKPGAVSPGKRGTFASLYKRGATLGDGAFSVVYEAADKSTGESYAVKVVTKSELNEEDAIALQDEIQVLQELQHPNIIRLYEVFEEKEFWYLVTEKMSGGELFDRIVEKSFYNEKEARDVCKILFEAIAYCHENSVAHRDLKPENLLLRSEDNDSELKIADFGFAKKMLAPDSLITQCGTPGYVAPEILEGVPYDTKSDMWSLGVIAYVLLGGYPPFMDENQQVLFRKIRGGHYEFHEEYWGAVSADAKDLISRLLTVAPAERISAEDALGHKWMTQRDSVLAGQCLASNLAELKKYNAKRRFKGAVNAVIAVNRANKVTSLGVDFKQHLD